MTTNNGGEAMQHQKRTVACVLKSGGIYDMAWVHKLRLQVARHHPDFRFVCLTDLVDERPFGVDIVPLVHDLPGWWSKLELFRPGLLPAGSRVLYLDLDVVVFQDLAALFDLELRNDAGEYHGFAALRGFQRRNVLNSSVMLWDADCDLARDIWKVFEPRKKTIMRRLVKEGDQEWITAVAGNHARILQESLPKGYVRSFKADHLDRITVTKPPADLHVLVMHGEPKMPNLPTCHWARLAWDGEPPGDHTPICERPEVVAKIGRKRKASP